MINTPKQLHLYLFEDLFVATILWTLTIPLQFTQCSFNELNTISSINCSGYNNGKWFHLSSRLHFVVSRIDNFSRLYGSGLSIFYSSWLLRRHSYPASGLMF